MNSWETSPAAWHHLFQKVSALVSNWNTDNLQNLFWLISLSPRPIYTIAIPAVTGEQGLAQLPADLLLTSTN